MVDVWAVHLYYYWILVGLIRNRYGWPHLLVFAGRRSGDSHAAGYYSNDDAKPGWWEIMVGPGKGIDTNKYFVICSNILGSCMGSTGPGSINPKTGKPFGLDFPVVTIGDMVTAQRR